MGMTVDFKPKDKIIIEELFDGRLEQFGIREKIVKGYTSTNFRYLTDWSKTYIRVYGDELVDSFTWHIPNPPKGRPRMVLAVIEKVFDTNIYSNIEPQFWGFETVDEWKSDWGEEYEMFMHSSP